MFTGLIEEIGVVAELRPMGSNLRLSVRAAKIMDDLKVDDSVSIQGACQTAVTVNDSLFSVDTVSETIKKSTLGSLRVGSHVNLERAVRPIDRLGGHLVQGHVDTVGHVASVDSVQGSWELYVTFPEYYSKYVVPVGSICINGVSLTVAETKNGWLKVAVIPHTWSVTTLRLLKKSDPVNLEFDIIGKYVERILEGQKNETNNGLAAYVNSFEKRGY